MTFFTSIERAAHTGANGHNHLCTPTQAQADAGNYLKGRATFHGMRVAIENPRGTLRKWRAADGTNGANLMKFHYGYFEGVRGADGDELDCFIGPAPESGMAYVINQRMHGAFDEHKVMLGFPDQRTAEAGYLSNYTAGWAGMDSCVPCTIAQLKWWMANGDLSQPLTKDQLPKDGRKDMDKVLWDSANQPVGASLAQVLYQIRAHDGAEGLMFDRLSVTEILADADGVLALDALVIPLAKLHPRMAVLQKVMDRAGGGLTVTAMQVSDPFTQKGTTNVAVVYELSDGQTVSVFFHNPDVTPKKILPGDDVVSWKWMLNKKDVTIAVAPERGRDLNVRTVAARIMALASKNSARFVSANSRRAAQMETIEGLKGELATKEAELEGLERQIDELTVAGQSKFSRLVHGTSATQDAYIRAKDAGGTDPNTGKTAEELSAQVDAEAAQIKALQAALNDEEAPVVDPVEPVAEVVPQPEPVVEPVAAPAVADMTYRDVDDMFTAFYPNTPAGEEAWKTIAADTEGTGKVLTPHAESVIAQLREAGYTVAQGEDPPQSADADALLAALADPVGVPQPEPDAAVAEPTIDPHAGDEELDRAANTGYAAGLEGNTTPPDWAADDEDVLYAAWLTGNKRGLAERAEIAAREEAEATAAAEAQAAADAETQAEAERIAAEQARTGADAQAEADRVAAEAAAAEEAARVAAQAEAAAQADAGRAASTAFLNSVIDGSVDMSDAGLPAQLTGIHQANKDDADMQVLFKQAVKAYSAYAIAQANAALAQ